MPITTTSGGVNAVRIVILYPNKNKRPTLHITPIITTSKERTVLLKERKKTNNISALKTSDPIKKIFISF